MALGLSKALSKQSTVLDYVLPLVARTLQTEHLDLSILSGLVDATLTTLDDTTFHVLIGC